MLNIEFSAFLEDVRIKVNNKLDDISNSFTSQNLLHESIKYVISKRGKRLRPCFVYAVGSALGAQSENLIHTAAAIELTHLATLIFDDLPCFDNDDLRHGAPSCHISFGESTAILCAYSLQNKAFEILSNLKISSEYCNRMISYLAKKIGAEGLALGEHLDLMTFGKKVSKEDLEIIYLRKTGDLLAASIILGALVATKQEENLLNNLEKYAECMGLAFQIHDDLLKYYGDQEIIGKNPASDEKNHKPTIVDIIGIKEAEKIKENLQLKTQEYLNKTGYDFSYLTAATKYSLTPPKA